SVVILITQTPTLFPYTTLFRSEDNRAELCAVHAAGCIYDRITEFLDDFIVGGLAWFDELVRQPVRVENREAHFAEHGGNGAFAEIGRASCRERVEDAGGGGGVV